MILILFFLLLAAWLLACVFYRASQWCLDRRLKILVHLALAVLGVGAAYGLLRLTGAIVFPSDNTWSINFLNASWRDDGVRLLVPFGGAFAGTAAALAVRRKKSVSSSRPEIKEKM